MKFKKLFILSVPTILAPMCSLFGTSCSCTGKTMTIKDKEGNQLPTSIEVGNSITLAAYDESGNVISNVTFETKSTCIELEGNVVTTVAVGEASITCSASGYADTKWDFNVVEPEVYDYSVDINEVLTGKYERKASLIDITETTESEATGKYLTFIKENPDAFYDDIAFGLYILSNAYDLEELQAESSGKLCLTLTEVDLDNQLISLDIKADHLYFISSETVGPDAENYKIKVNGYIKITGIKFDDINYGGDDEGKYIWSMWFDVNDIFVTGREFDWSITSDMEETKYFSTMSRELDIKGYCDQDSDNTIKDYFQKIVDQSDVWATIDEERLYIDSFQNVANI